MCGFAREQLSAARSWWAERDDRVVAAARGIAVGVVVLLLVRALGAGIPWIPDLRGLFDGGRSDPQARGSIIYEGQTAEDYSARLLVVIGHGRAILPVKAKQNWDKPGGLLSGDLQSTNGTAKVQDPDDGSRPAKLQVGVTYCAEGTTTATGAGTSGHKRPKKVQLDLGSLVVCDAEVLNSEYNNAAFVQDDTPASFQGRFETQVRSAAVAATKAAPCPTKQLATYRTKEFAQKVRRTIASNSEVAQEDVTVTRPDIGRTDAPTCKLLDRQLRQLANPASSSPGIDFLYLGTAASAVEDSCYVGFGSQPLERLSSMKVRPRS